MAERLAPRDIFAQQRGHLFPWLPVCLAIGICAYFGLRFEPSHVVIGGVVAAGACLILASRRMRLDARPVAIGLACVGLGFGLAAIRAHSVAAPVLDFRYYGPVSGRIIAMDRSASDAMRLTLDHIVLDNVPQGDLPRKVRLSLHGNRSWDTELRPGALVMTTAHLSPPNGPVEPGGFDFRRHSWFQQIGAVGYTRVPLLARGPPDGAWALAIFRLRRMISGFLQTALPGDVGGFAAAITTGDRSGLSQTAIEALRVTNTAHLLAISGLHMGLLSGFVFLALRYALALLPLGLLRWPAKKHAAVGALGVATLYLAMSGGNVATQRAYIMVLVALVAVLLDRRAMSLRAVALAAVIVLVLRPDAVLSPGFQMSFAATTALVAAFGAFRDIGWTVSSPLLRSLSGVLLSSVIAGLATAPVGAAHFNHIARFGLIANVACVPVMGTLVVPFAVGAAVLAPLGLSELPLFVMALGLEWILEVSSWISTWPDARRHVPAPPLAVLPMMALGGLWLALWQTRARLLGVVPMVLAVVLWTQANRPDILIAPEATLVGMHTADGRAVSKAKGAGFVARVWLENDGIGGGQARAAARWGRERWIDLGNARVWHINGKRDAAAFEGCARGDIVVTRVDLGRLDCVQHSPASLRDTGAVAYRWRNNGWVMHTDRDHVGARLWTGYASAGEAWWRFTTAWPTAQRRTARSE